MHSHNELKIDVKPNQACTCLYTAVPQSGNFLCTVIRAWPCSTELMFLDIDAYTYCSCSSQCEVLAYNQPHNRRTLFQAETHVAVIAGTAVWPLVVYTAYRY